MAGNSFGDLFKITTFGESHGKGVGVIIDGVPPGLPLSEDDIQPAMNRRKPGQSDLTTPRSEADKVTIMSGVFEGKTTGTSLMIILYNTNTKSEDYHDIVNKYRPGHADFSYDQKYGFRDWRGSGRASGRETAGRVAAGAVATKLLKHFGINIIAYTKEAAGIKCQSFDPSVIDKNPMRTCDPEAATQIEKKIIALKEEGNSAGGIIECRVNGLPAGLGEPVFDKLDASLAHAILSIGSIKGFELGSGFACAGMTGREHNDERSAEEGFLTNNAGGIIGGISTGQEIIFRAAVKPTASITAEQTTIDKQGNTVKIKTEGRHDPIICPRIIPVIEAMTALVLADSLLRQETLKVLK